MPGGDEKSVRPAAVLPGLIAGVTETLVVQPLDLVKTRFQIYEGANPSLLRGFRDVYREGGIFRFYRGMIPEVASTAPARTAMYAGYTWTLHALQRMEGQHQLVPHLRLEHLIAGFASGVPEAVVVTPLQLVKVRLQAKEHLGRYNNAFHCVGTILRQEGPVALMTGLSSTTCRNCAFNSIYFWSQSHLKARFVEASGAAEDSHAPGHLVAALRTSACAFFSGAFATCFNAPFDTAKSRIQQQVTPEGEGQVLKYRGTLQTLRLVWQEEGLRAMYKGFAPKLLRMSCGTAVGMSTFEAAQRFFDA